MDVSSFFFLDLCPLSACHYLLFECHCGLVETLSLLALPLTVNLLFLSIGCIQLNLKSNLSTAPSFSALYRTTSCFMKQSLTSVRRLPVGNLSHHNTYPIYVGSMNPTFISSQSSTWSFSCFLCLTVGPANVIKSLQSFGSLEFITARMKM